MQGRSPAYTVLIAGGEEVDKLLREGKQVVVTVVDETKRYEDLRDGRIGRRELGSLRNRPR